MTNVRRLALDRRTFLRGSTAALALPWLDAMAPACAPTPVAPVRAVFVFAPNGFDPPRWRPQGAGRDAKFGETLAPLQPLRDRLTVFSGLALDAGRSHGDGPGDHARAAASFLTCAHPRKTDGADIHVGVSIDQLLAEHVGKATRLPSLEVGLERGRSAGGCDSGYSCAYSSNVSWRSATTPVAKETEPRAVFERLFGSVDGARDTATARRERDRTRSILDVVLADAKSLDRQLGAGDRSKLGDYLAAVRDFELRLGKLDEAAAEATPAPDGLLDDGNSYEQRLALMYEVVALALATDSTRVVSFMVANAGSNRSYRSIGVREGHHNLSHHGRDANKRAAIGRIDRFRVEHLARFLERLAAEPGGDGDLLSCSLVVFGSGLGDGNRHNHDHLPVLLAGEGGGAARGRGHIDLGVDTPMANLYLAIARSMGRTDTAFADSSGELGLR
ncbi:MAG: DUF1552 domain-containing protein [Planctomycetes bacterium]|nr:DUF1552 domain-containing protein [Planctomycetota bacterium]